MAAEKGNKYWQFREKHGRGYKYTPESLWAEAVKYFNWVEDNPLEEVRAFPFKGEVTMCSVPKMRAMTLTAFCLFADIELQTFRNYRDAKDFFVVTARIDAVIKSQKFEGAAADMLNPNIIARDLGLTERTDHTTQGGKLENFVQIYLPEKDK